jgi:hypothetical protein
MKKFKKDKKVLRAQAGDFIGSKRMQFPHEKQNESFISFENPIRNINEGSKYLIRLMGGDPDLPHNMNMQRLHSTQFKSSGDRAMDLSRKIIPSEINPTVSTAPTSSAPRRIPGKAAPAPSALKAASAPKFSGYSEYDYLTAPSATSPSAAAPSSEKNAMEGYKKQSPSSMQDLSAFLKKAAKAPDATPELAKAAGEIPKTKSGLKKFMQDYGQFIALGAMAGAGGKGGQIAAPIIAALPGLIEMMKKKKKPQFDEKLMPAPGVQVGMAHGGSMKKSSGGETPKKSEGGAIRKFKGGSMKGNTMDSTLTPKYAKGGKTMGKATGEMPQHKKMAMGKPTPQSTGQKFAKGGTTKCAGGGMPRGYGVAKKIRPTGPMN